MPDVLILYASKHGHTAKIATRIADVMKRDGVAVHLYDADSAYDLKPGLYDGIILGASIHAGHYQSEIVKWAKSYATGLNGMPSAFFSVCLTAADDTDESREATRKYLDDLADETGWTPRRSTTFAGALEYLEYDFATRLLMRLLMRRMHHSTDASRDVDYTDWEAVDAFAHDCTKTVAGLAAPTNSSLAMAAEWEGAQPPHDS